MDKLEKNILATVIYYDGLNYPLTAFEIWKYLIRSDYYSKERDLDSVPLHAIIKKMQEGSLRHFISQKNGFYFLKERHELADTRITRAKISKGKVTRLKKIIWWLRFVPFVRMIGITGGLAMKNAQPKSDWDLFIVLKHGKIWTGRTLITLALHAWGKRRHGKKISDRVCLNFFVTDQSLEVITKDLFSASEYMFLFPLYGFSTFNRFQIKNQWIASMKPAYDLTAVSPLATIGDNYVGAQIKRFLEILLRPVWIENKLRTWEKKRIMQNPKTHQEGSFVYANDDALVFLPRPHGPKIFQVFKEKLNAINID